MDATSRGTARDDSGRTARAPRVSSVIDFSRRESSRTSTDSPSISLGSGGLDLNRNFPAGWGVDVLGSGDHPMSEPEVHALVRAVKARPNVCGYNAFHTAGGFMLRPSSSLPDSQLPPEDVFIFKKFGEHSTPLTTYPVHSVYEDLTWDKSRVMVAPVTTGHTTIWACTPGPPSSGMRSTGPPVNTRPPTCGTWVDACAGHGRM